MRHFTPIAGLIVTLALTGCSPAPQTPAAASSDAPSSSLDLKSAMPAAASVIAEASASAPAQCRAEIGEAAAKTLADRCRMVSPATHPPCNPDNSCQMIQDEIDRSCAIWDKDTSQPRPKECTA